MGYRPPAPPQSGPAIATSPATSPAPSRRGRLVLVGIALGLGLLVTVGATLQSTFADRDEHLAAVAAPPGVADGGETTGAPRAPDPAADPATDPATVAISTQGTLPEGLAQRIAQDPAIEASTVVHGDTLALEATWDATGTPVDELPAGWRYPVEVLAVEPAAYADLLEVAAVADLGADEALLSESSAAVRRLGVGARLRFSDGTELTVAGVLPDALVGAGEVLVTSASPLAPDRPRYVLARQVAPENDLARYHDEDGPGLVLVRGGEVPVLRHSADVMAPARLKWAFGEFAITDGPGRWVQQGVTWLRAAYREQEVPIIGSLECHEAMFAPLTAALQELTDQGLAHLVDPEDSDGCWAPRVQGGTTLSSHAWGIAIDLNVQGNHYGAEPTMPTEVIETFTRHGFVWGGDWLIPDGMHFELVVDRPPGERWLPETRS